MGTALDCRIAGRSLVYVVTEDWFFVTHFLPLARAARLAGYQITVVTNVTADRDTIEREGLRVIPLSANRASFSLVAFARLIFKLRAILRNLNPDVVHAIALKSVLLAGLATRGFGWAKVYSLTGLGQLWISHQPTMQVARAGIRGVLGLLGRDRAAVFTFENPDDHAELGQSPKAVVIGGWGISANEFTPVKRTADGKMRLAYLGRLLKAKGIEDAVRAVTLARAAGHPVELHLWGKVDAANPTSYTPEELLALSEHAWIVWHGTAASPRDVWEQADIAILLSAREGMPRMLIEAAACGLPMIATDVPGCRTMVRHGIDGFLVPCHNPVAAAEAIGVVASDSALRGRLGEAARKGFESRFSTDVIVPRIIKLYGDLLTQAPVRFQN